MNIDSNNPSIEFNANDRCDRCIAQAYMSASRDGLELLFCAHHGREFHLALQNDGWEMAYDTAALEQLYPNTNRVNA